MGLVLGMVFKFYTIVTKELKLNVGKHWGANSYNCRSYKERTGSGTILPPPSWIGLSLNKSAYVGMWMLDLDLSIVLMYEFHEKWMH